MMFLMIFDFSRKSGIKFGVWMWGTPKGKGVWGWREVSGKFPGISRELSWKFPGNLDRDGEGPSVQKMIL